MLKPRVSAFLSLLFVFLSGTLVGGLGYRWYSVNSAGDKAFAQRKGNPPDPAEVKRRIIAEMTDAVKLDPTQVEQVSRILDETRAKFDVIHDSMNKEGHQIWQEQIEKVNEVLRPEQRLLYQQLQEKHARDRAERKKKRGIQQDPKK